MKKTPKLLLLLWLSFPIATLANNGEKGKKEDPDISGMVIHSESGKPLKDVFITAYNAAHKEKFTLSNANGNFNLTDLRPGTYKFVFEKDGFKRVVKEKIILRSNEDVQLNVEMMEEEIIFDLLPSPFHLSRAR
jgi:hypothetical protein